MAKRLENDKRRFPQIYTFQPPAPKCGCGRLAEFEVYDHHEPHCRTCMLDAVDCSVPVLVKRIDGGYDHAS